MVYWKQTGRVTLLFAELKRKGLRASLPEELPFKETQFSLKKADRSATLIALLPPSTSPPLYSCVH